MKKTALIAIPFALSLFSGCQQGEVKVTKSGNGSNSGAVTAKVNDASWKSTTASAFLKDGTLLVMEAASADSTRIKFELNDKQLREYDVSNPFDGVAIYRQGLFSFPSTGSQGKVKLTKIDTVKRKISGTFEFRGEEPNYATVAHVTSGVFTDISYSVYNSPVIAKSLTATIDNVPFSASMVYSSSNSGINYVSGSSGSTQISVYFDDTALGDYPVGGFSFSGFSYFTGSVQYSATSGKITITSYDSVTEKVTGTFSGVLTDGSTGNTKNLTNGAFTAVLK